MNKSDYDKYYKKGGTYVIPVELFNELFDELEELKKNQRLTQEKRNHLHLELDEIVESLQTQLQQKKNIIKEARKYIEKNWISQKDADNYRFDDEGLDIEISDIAVLFDILDKEVKKSETKKN